MNTKIVFDQKVSYGWSFRGFGGSSRFAGRWSISGVMIESQVLCSSYRINCMIVLVTLQYVGWEKFNVCCQSVGYGWSLFGFVEIFGRFERFEERQNTFGMMIQSSVISWYGLCEGRLDVLRYAELCLSR